MSHNCLFWALLAAIAWGITPLFEKLGLLKANPSTVLFLQALVVFVTISVIWFIRSEHSVQEQFAQLDATTLAFIIGAALVGGIVGEYAYLRAISGESAGIAVSLTSMYPLVTIFLTSLFLGEELTFSNGSGAILVVIGVLLLTASDPSTADSEENTAITQKLSDCELDESSQPISIGSQVQSQTVRVPVCDILVAHEKTG